jgi:hypothetical protein
VVLSLRISVAHSTGGGIVAEQGDTNPRRRPVKMCLQLYADDVEFEINLEQNKTGPSPAITQADLNRIIQTAHKAATAQGILAVKPS